MSSSYIEEINQVSLPPMSAGFLNPEPVPTSILILYIALLIFTFIITFIPVCTLYHKILSKIYRSNLRTSLLLLAIPLAILLAGSRLVNLLIPYRELKQVAIMGIEMPIFYLGFTNLQYTNTKVFGLKNCLTAHKFHDVFLNTNLLHPFDDMWRYPSKVQTHTIQISPNTTISSQSKLHRLVLNYNCLDNYFQQVHIERDNHELAYKIDTYLDILASKRVKAYLLDLDNHFPDSKIKLNNVQFFTKGSIAFLVYTPDELPLELVEDAIQQIFISPTEKPIKEVRLLYPNQSVYKRIPSK